MALTIVSLENVKETRGTYQKSCSLNINIPVSGYFDLVHEGIPSDVDSDMSGRARSVCFSAPSTI